MREHIPLERTRGFTNRSVDTETHRTRQAERNPTATVREFRTEHPRKKRATNIRTKTAKVRNASESRGNARVGTSKIIAIILSGFKREVYIISQTISGFKRRFTTKYNPFRFQTGKGSERTRKNPKRPERTRKNSKRPERTRKHPKGSERTRKDAKGSSDSRTCLA